MTTSQKAFQKLIETKKLSKRRKEVAEALFYSGKAMTSRMLESWCILSIGDKLDYSHLERCTICGRFAELEKANVIRVVKTDKCEVTGETAKFYSVIENI